VRKLLITMSGICNFFGVYESLWLGHAERGLMLVIAGTIFGVYLALFNIDKRLQGWNGSVVVGRLLADLREANALVTTVTSRRDEIAEQRDRYYALYVDLKSAAHTAAEGPCEKVFTDDDGKKIILTGAPLVAVKKSGNLWDTPVTRTSKKKVKQVKRAKR
jgi:hypothetical protein